jgi:GAF domain-containing protein
MKNSLLPASFEPLLSTTDTPGPALSDLLALVGEELRADRCFLYLRNPKTVMGRIAFCWCRDASIPNVTESAWKTDISIALKDPLFAAALRTDPSIYVEDVKVADPAVVNQDFEARTFGHRALIHAHITEGRKLWGILQPCVFDQPRQWLASDRQLIEELLPRLLPLVKAYIRQTLG